MEYSRSNGDSEPNSGGDGETNLGTAPNKKRSLRKLLLLGVGLDVAPNPWKVGLSKMVVSFWFPPQPTKSGYQLQKRQTQLEVRAASGWVEQKPSAWVRTPSAPHLPVLPPQQQTVLKDNPPPKTTKGFPKRGWVQWGWVVKSPRGFLKAS